MIKKYIFFCFLTLVILICGCITSIPSDNSKSSQISGKKLATWHERGNSTIESSAVIPQSQNDIKLNIVYAWRLPKDIKNSPNDYFNILTSQLESNQEILVIAVVFIIPGERSNQVISLGTNNLFVSQSDRRINAIGVKHGIGGNHFFGPSEEYVKNLIANGGAVYIVDKNTPVKIYAYDGIGTISTDYWEIPPGTGFH